MATLLVAEDDPHIRRVLEVTLRRQGFDVTTVGDGTEAIAALQSGTFDCIVVDGMMPGMDGVDVCRWAKANPATADVPVIMVSARTSRTNEAEVLAAGAAAFLRKPFDAQVLGAAIRKACDGRRD